VIISLCVHAVQAERCKPDSSVYKVVKEQLSSVLGG